MKIPHFATFIFFILITCCQVSGQPYDIFWKKKADSLIKSGIDTVIHYEPWTSPLTQEYTDSGVNYNRSYLLWKVKQRLFVLKYFDYENFNKHTWGTTIQVTAVKDSFEIFQYLNFNFQKVVSDSLLRAKIRYKVDNTIMIDDYNKFTVSDDGYTAIYVYTKGRIYQNGYSASDLVDGTVLNADGTFREKRESLNYETNINKAVFKLITKIEKQVALLK